MQFISMGKFHHRHYLPGEFRFSQELKKLINQAMLTADAGTQTVAYSSIPNGPAYKNKQVIASSQEGLTICVTYIAH